MKNTQSVSTAAAVAVIGLGAMTGPTGADNASTGPTGINSQGLTLTGRGISIGQVEPGRPGEAVAISDPGDKNGEWFWDHGVDRKPGTGDAGEGNGLRDSGEAYVDLNGDGMYTAGLPNAHPNISPWQTFSQATAPPPRTPTLNGDGPSTGPGSYISLDHYERKFRNRHSLDPNVDRHASSVAGVMIGSGATPKSVAQDAHLFSSALDGPFNPGQPEAALSAQHVALQTSGDVRAINLSFGQSLEGNTALNGNSLITEFIDWSASDHDTLYVVAGNQGLGGFPAPTDSFSGITVAATTKDEVFTDENNNLVWDAFEPLTDRNGDGTWTAGAAFDRVAEFNNFAEDAAGARRSVDLVAPGGNIIMPTLGGGNERASGTSYAAPHVTGTVALLQEYGDAYLSFTSRSHEVMKAVLMNSADKREDNGDGKLLGMEKTIVDAPERRIGDTFADSNGNNRIDPGESYQDLNMNGKFDLGGEPFVDTNNNNWHDSGEDFSDSNGNGKWDAGWSPITPYYDSDANGAQNPGGKDWLESDAAKDRSIPLDDQLGSGQLNAKRALTQFKPGEHHPGLVPLIGWDWGLAPGAGDFQKYIFNSPLEEGSYLAATLAWDRATDLNDLFIPGYTEGMYDIGESFAAHDLTNLDLYLMRRGATDPTQSLWSSISLVDSVEHMFYQIPETADYELWVHQADAPVGAQSYGLAWWGKTPSLPRMPEGSSTLIVFVCGLVGLSAFGRTAPGPRHQAPPTAGSK